MMCCISAGAHGHGHWPTTQPWASLVMDTIELGASDLVMVIGIGLGAIELVGETTM